MGLNDTFFQSPYLVNLLPRNLIKNGGFDFFQRGTSQAGVDSAASNTYLSDRFFFFTNSAAVVTLSRSTDVPTLAQSGYQSTYSLLIDCTTADASVGASDSTTVNYRMEGYEWAAIKNRLVTLSFWVKATKTGIYCISFKNNGSDRSYVAEYTINAADTWEKKIISAVLNPTGGTDDFTTGTGLSISWCLMAGTDRQTTPGAWQTGNFNATANQVNAMDSTSNDFRITQVCLNVGPTAMGFQRSENSISDELAACQRYYEKSYNLEVAPGTVDTSGSVIIRAAATFVDIYCVMKVDKRIAGFTALAYSPGTGAVGNIRNQTSGADLAASIGSTFMGQMGFLVEAAGGTDQNRYSVHWTADAEL